MKKIFLLCIFVILLTGCTSIQNSTLDNIINNSLGSKVNTKNVNRNGYQYYLPRGLSVLESTNYNEVLKDQKYMYYLYVDVVSYYHNTSFLYTVNKQAYASLSIQNGDRKGYLEINNYKNEQYLIEIMYNYAKIEVVVYESDINLSVAYAISVLSSITYDDNVIQNALSNRILDGATEESFDIFEIVGRNNFLEFESETSSNEENRDPDYIN